MNSYCDILYQLYFASNTKILLDSHRRSIFQHEIRAEQLQEEAWKIQLLSLQKRRSEPMLADFVHWFVGQPPVKTIAFFLKDDEVPMEALPRVN